MSKRVDLSSSEMAAVVTRDPILEVEDYVDPKNIERDSLKVICRVRPLWKEEDVKFEPCPGAGFLNTMLVCHHGNDRSDALVIRVFGEGMDYLMNKTQELAATKLFHEIGVSPIIHCLFKNGICMEFVQGTTFAWADLSGLRDVKVIKAVARETAKLHSSRTRELALSKYGYGFKEDEAEGARKIKEFFDNWPTTIGEPEADELFKSSFPSFEQLKQEAATMLDVFEGMHNSLLICHSDLNPTNVIYMPEEDRAIFIDFDFSGFNWPIMDLATFIEFSGVGISPDVEGTKRFPDDFVKEFLREYLRALEVFDHEVSDSDVDSLFTLTMKGILAVYLFYGMAFIFLASSERERHGVRKADMIGNACNMLAWYFKNKDVILATESDTPAQWPWEKQN